MSCEIHRHYLVDLKVIGVEKGKKVARTRTQQNNEKSAVNQVVGNLHTKTHHQNQKLDYNRQSNSEDIRRVSPHPLV